VNVPRRPIRFGTLAEAVADAEGLLARGYDKAGNWSLAQCCNHLANWLTYPVSGFPRMPLLLRPPMAIVRTLMGRKLLNKFLAEGMPAGKMTIPESVPAPGGDDAAAVGRLKEAVRRFEAHAGEYLPSPLFGPLTRAEALQVQVKHAEHHLSFLTPR
jgi:hypothetical protein